MHGAAWHARHLLERTAHDEEAQEYMRMVGCSSAGARRVRDGLTLSVCGPPLALLCPFFLRFFSGCAERPQTLGGRGILPVSATQAPPSSSRSGHQGHAQALFFEITYPMMV